jgi:hypothetical protein
VGCGVWGVGCGVWGVGCGVWGVGCGVWGVVCGVWCAMQAVWGVGRAPHGVWSDTARLDTLTSRTHCPQHDSQSPIVDAEPIHVPFCIHLQHTEWGKAN